MNQIIKNQLEELIGEEVSYKGQNILIEKYKELQGLIVVRTNSRSYNFRPSEIQECFLDLIGEKIEGKTFTPTSIDKKSFVAPEENASIKSALLEVLNKVKTDANFVPQAKAVCQITDAMVKVHKAEMEMYKLQNGEL